MRYGSEIAVVSGVFFFQAEDGIRDLVRSRGLGDVYKRQLLHLFNPNTGEDYSTLQLDQNIEASPAVYGNMLVVGTYAKKLYLSLIHI